ncbi:hypothetical protein Ahy_A10g050676 [Arachis hypogaea]|uniref:Transposase MuDR plant domain-containing protein n=1 Tax=Arachis hypogaea TaxID=3818 RepID=A0A445BA40_ARAHY|nr:hypothetical protein Ahy_A10g050676 [Arachis hypogaea]
MLEEDCISAERSDSLGDDESEDDDYQPKSDDASDDADSDEQWSEFSSKDSAMEVTFDDSDDDWNGDGGLFDVDITTMKDSQKMKESVAAESVEGEFSASFTKEREKVMATRLRDEDDGYNSEELWDVPVSDDEGDPSLRKYPFHKYLKNIKEYKWKVGTMYVDKNAFKKCVTSYVVHSDRGLWFSKCDSRRCKTATKIGIMRSQWLSKAFVKKICENPKIKLRTLMKKAHSKWNVDLTKSKNARVKQLALDEINGTYGEQYRRIHDYAVKLMRLNPAQPSKKSAGTIRTRNPIKIATKATVKAATKTQPKRKSNAQDVEIQQSQTSSKRAKCTSNNSQSQPSTITINSPSRRILKYMAKTPSKASKALE